MSLFRRISNLFSQSRVDRETDAELRSHIEMRVEDNEAAGMAPGEARRDAMLRFGNQTKAREGVNAVDVVLAVESISMDARYAFRQLARSPGFAVATILTISLGVGASTAIFGVVNSDVYKRQVQMYSRTRRMHSGLSDEMLRLAVEQFLPSAGAGMLVTIVLLRYAPTALWMLPGIWQVVFSLGVFSSCRFLPRPMIAAGAWYLVTGLICLCLLYTSRCV